MMIYLLLALSVFAVPNSEKRKNVQEYLETYVKAETFYKELGAKDVQFPVKDLKNGYMTVYPPPGERLFTFALFRGAAEDDLLVMESSDCGPGCRYFFQGLRFSKGEFVNRKNLQEYYAPAEIQAAARALVKEVKKKGWPEETDLRFLLPKEGKRAPVYVIKYPANPAVNETYVEIGSLTWDKKSFRFKFRKARKAVDKGVLDLT
jgi:hypothetical protein